MWEVYVKVGLPFLPCYEFSGALTADIDWGRPLWSNFRQQGVHASSTTFGCDKDVALSDRNLLEPRLRIGIAVQKMIELRVC